MKLELQQIVLPFGVFQKGVSLTFTAPVTGLSGPSGVGKTTVMELIAGLRKPHRGKVVFNDRVLTDPATRTFVPAWERKIGFVPQDQALFPHLTVAENVCYSAPGTTKDAILAAHASIIEILELSPILERSVGMLSGGEKGRVALARALFSDPALLLLDEPLAHLDDRLRQRALDHFRVIRNALKIPIIFVSHSKAEIDSICDEVLVIE